MSHFKIKSLNKAVILIAALFISCQPKENLHELIFIDTPCKNGALPFLFSSENKTLLSWVEYESDTTDVLKFSTLINGAWSEEKTIAHGSDWFVNWADYPSIVEFGNGKYLAAHWLQKSAQGTYDYDIKLSLSDNNGSQWSSPITIHNDGVAAEHGFVSMAAYGDSLLFASWLDGRFTKGHNHDGNHDSNQAMTLRSAFINADGVVSNRMELDSRVCDCCQTSSTVVDEDVFVVYRDRSPDEVRDISLVRRKNGLWQNPEDISIDNWKIAGCPVNGPSISSNNNQIAIAWYTMDQDTGKVFLKISNNNAESFGERIRIDHGQALGRVKIKHSNKGDIFVCWFEMHEENSSLLLKRFNSEGLLIEEWNIATVSSGRESGFPALSIQGDELILTWTQNHNSTRIRSALIKI